MTPRVRSVPLDLHLPSAFESDALDPDADADPKPENRLAVSATDHRRELWYRAPRRVPRSGRCGQGSALAGDQSDDAKDLLVWKWLKGQSAAPSEFGDPTATTSYALCLYDQERARRACSSADGTAGQICDIQHGRACWRPTQGVFAIATRHSPQADYARSS